MKISVIQILFLWISIVLVFVFKVYESAAGQVMTAQIIEYDREIKRLKLENMELEVVLYRNQSLQYIEERARAWGYRDPTKKQIINLQ